MTTISYSSLRQNLRSVMDNINSDRSVFEVARKGQETVVMMSKHDYDSLQETLYLLSSKANADRLHESLQQAEAGEFIHHDLIED